MTDTTHSAPAAAADDEALRKKLLARIAVAGVTIVGLLGGLAVYDALNRPEAPSLPKMAAAPVEEKLEPKTEERPIEEKPSEPLAEEKADETLEGAATPQVPERTETPLALPAAEEKTPKAAKPLTPPATAVAAGIKPPERAAAAIKPDARRELARVMPEESRPAAHAHSRPPAHAPASRPLGQAVEAAKRFFVQVGVFSNYHNAEELVARLAEAGIPARIESHVQIGPFASRAEVAAARAKLKAMGLDEGLLVRR